jgi:hypothetical protein
MPLRQPARLANCRAGNRSIPSCIHIHFQGDWHLQYACKPESSSVRRRHDQSPHAVQQFGGPECYCTGATFVRGKRKIMATGERGTANCRRLTAAFSISACSAG